MPVLYAHQTSTTALMIERSMLVAADPGVGKTAMGIKVAEHFKAHPIRSGKTLVVAPLSLLEVAWAEDCAKFSLDLKPCILWAPTPAKRKKVLAEASGDLFLVNYEGFKKIIPWCRKQNFDCLMVDESSCLVNPRSQISKATREFATSIPKRFCLSGTPMPNSELDIWGQMAVVNPSLLGWNYWNFRAAYAYQTGYMGYEWRVNPEARERLMRTIAPNAVFISKADCLDLPEKTFVVRQVYMDPDQQDAYDRMVRDKILPLVEGRVALASNILAEIMKLRQVTSGWVRDADGNDYTFSDSKARVLDEVLGELGSRQAIIWVEFIHDADELERRLAPNAVKIIGGLHPDEFKTRLDAFKNGSKRYLIAHPKTVGHGVTLTNCHYAVYYSLSYSWQSYVQSQDRIHRIGQTDKVSYTHLLCRKSIDEAIYWALQKKDSMAKAAMAYLRASA